MNDFVKRISHLSQKQLIVLAAELQKKLAAQTQEAAQAQHATQQSTQQSVQQESNIINEEIVSPVEKEVGVEFNLVWESVDKPEQVNADSHYIVVAWDDSDAGMWRETLSAGNGSFSICTAEQFSLTENTLSSSQLSSGLERLGDFLKNHEAEKAVVIFTWPAVLAANSIYDAQQLQKLLSGGMIKLLQICAEKITYKIAQLTCNGVWTNQGETVNADQGPQLGLSKVAAIEAPVIWLGSIDIDKLNSQQCQSALQAIAVCVAKHEDVVALRNNQLLVSRLAPSEIAEQSQSVEVTGTYLITGGNGGLGLATAAKLAAMGVKKIALVSRSGLKKVEKQPKLLAFVEQIKNSGAEIIDFKADATSQEALGNIINQLHTNDSPLTGVVLAAGESDSCSLFELTADKYWSSIQTKVQSAWALHQLTKDIPNCQFIAYSSIASVWGSALGGAYSAANAFLDSVVAHRHSINLPAVAINWGPWADVGMSTGQQATFLARSGLKNLAPENASDILVKLIAGENNIQHVVADVDWKKFIELQELRGQRPLFNQLKKLIGADEALDNDGSLPAFFEHLSDADESTRIQDIQQWVTQQLREILELDETELLRTNQPLHEFGVDSLLAVQFRNTLKSALKRPIPSTLVFDYPSISAIAKLIDALLFSISAAPEAANPSAMTATANNNEAIAVVGLGCRLPGGEGAEAYWKALVESRDCVTDAPARWDVEKYKGNKPGQAYTLSGGFLERIDDFDASFFNIAPREARAMDPQQRLVLEAAWQALEDAGYSEARLTGSNTGVYVGVGPNEYMAVATGSGAPDLDQLMGHLTTGNNLNVIAGRVSYALGLMGPSMAIDTACSSSLVALHTACQSLRNGECEMAIAGGVNTLLTPEAYVGPCSAQMLSPTGRCHTFDAAADGYVRGEGAGMVILKRLSDAQRDGDNVLAVIRASAVNQDGRSSSLTAPNGPAQQAVIRKALAQANLSAADIDYVEAHGTGTALGDPIELHALDATYASAADRDRTLMLGSVKSNIGHLESAAGVAGFIKVVLSLRHEAIPANLHFHQWNPNIDVPQDHFVIPTSLTPWPRGDRPRRGAVSSFGFSGTNAHIIIEDAPLTPIFESPVAKDERPAHILTLSGKSPGALESLVSRYAQRLSSATDDAADIAFSANTGRSHFGYRMAIVGQDVDEWAGALQSYQPGEAPNNGYRGEVISAPRIGFLFTGQGAQYAGMGKALYDADPDFKSHIETCSAQLRDGFGFALEELLWGEQQELLNETRYTQPALYVLQTGIVNYLRRSGVAPEAVLGHSVGEFAAAYCAGVFSLADGLALIQARGSLMWDHCEAGSMLVVFDQPSAVDAFVKKHSDKISIAAYNSARNTVVAGDSDTLNTLAEQLAAAQIKSVPLNVSHGFHSVQMTPMLEPFAERVNAVGLAAPRLGFYSTVTAQRETQALASVDYWVNHVQQPVNFQQSIQALGQSGIDVFIEIGPGATLTTLGQLNCDVENAVWLNTQLPQQEWQALLHSMAQLYVRGADIRWAGMDQPYQRQRIALPTYPFQRKRYWVNDVEKISMYSWMESAQQEMGDPILGRRLDTSRGETIFEMTYNWNRPFSLLDHKLYEVPVAPGASHLAMVTQAAIRSMDGKAIEFQDVVFPQPMVLQHEDIPARAQYAFTNSGNEVRLVAQSCQSSGRDPKEWQTHLTANVKVLPHIGKAKTKETIADLIEKAKQNLKGEDHYAAMWEEGYQLLDGFRWIDHVWLDKGWAVARMKPIGHSDENYVIPPGFLDSCFQSTRFSFGEGESEEEIINRMGESVEQKTGDIYIPFAIDRLTVHREPKGELWCLSRSREFDREHHEVFTSDLYLMDEQGNLVIEVEGLRGKRASKNLLNLDEFIPEKAIFSQDWREIPLNPDVKNDVTQPVLVVGEITAAQAVAEAMIAQGMTNTAYASLEDAANTIEGFDKSAALIYLNPTGSDVATEYSASKEFLALHKLMSEKLDQLMAVWFVTSNAMTVAHAFEPANAVGTSLWAAAGVLGNEIPDIPLLRIDVSVELNVAAIADLLVQEAKHFAGPDTQIAYRNGRRYVARLTENAQTKSQALAIPQEPFKVQLQDYGTFDNLQLIPIDRRVPQKDEIEIQVHAAEMNLKEVLATLGMITDYLEGHNIKEASMLPFGLECTGRVTRVGPKVKHLNVGDLVLAAAPGSMASFAITSEKAAIKLPEGVNLDQIAALPTGYLTAFYGLSKLAKLQKGEKVLIHAAAGGVGQAAVMLAHFLGAEVFATASPGKWAQLRAQGVKHIYNSRTVDFAEAVMRDTGGLGVDVVLNSLNGDFIPRSIDCVSANGRFVDIGKVGLWTEQQFSDYRKNAEYITFDWADVMMTQPGLREALLGELLPLIADGQLGYVPTTVFPVERIADGYRYLASAQNVGRLVLRFPPHTSNGEPKSRITLRDDAAYVVTGGLGALGLHTTQWLADEGAKHLIITSRSGKTNEDNDVVIGALRERGVNVDVIALDLENAQAVADLFATYADSSSPIKGIIHSAGMLDDAVLQNMTWERFSTVLGPKVIGTWNIHQASLNYDLDFLVCYSSSSTVLGSPGQANYVAANAYMNGLMQWRRSQGLCGTTVAWGPWAGAGMAAELSEQDQSRFAAIGFGTIPLELGLDTLRGLVNDSKGHSIVMPINSRTLAMAPLPPAARAFFSEAMSGKFGALSDLPPSDLLKPLVDEAPDDEKLQVISKHIRSELARVLGMDSADDIGENDRLFDLGLDSLMAVELRNRIQFSVGQRLPATLLFDYASVSALSIYLGTILCPEVSNSVQAMVEKEKALADENAKAAVAEMSDEEAEAALLAELND